ncbi:MAG: CRISPR-associated protein Cas4 [Gemmatimonadota bacterium]|nr:CRISPR-associated protein Cas4 [Gemmatimonadota bacterium]
MTGDLFAEDALLPISALQHLLFCERQCALIHIEGLWAENRLTVEGQHLHKKAHDGPDESRDGVRTVRGLRIRSLRLGLIGQADVVEFRRTADGRWSNPFPVEYKRGKPKSHRADEVQLCAQAMCLEEMVGTPVPAGALFYGATRRRVDVILDHELRGLTEGTCARLRQLVASGNTPRAAREPKCDACSLHQLCLPDVAAIASRASRYTERALSASLSASIPDRGPEAR